MWLLIVPFIPYLIANSFTMEQPKPDAFFGNIPFGQDGGTLGARGFLYAVSGFG